MAHCVSCGKKISTEAEYCPHCGLKVHDEGDENVLEKDRSTKSLPGSLLGVYFMLNVILMAGTSGNEEVMGIFIYTLIVMVIIFIRRSKDKPFNWLVNIVLLLQAVLVFATIMMTWGHIGGSDSMGAMILVGLLVFLCIVIVRLVYQGNRRLS